MVPDKSRCLLQIISLICQISDMTGGLVHDPYRFSRKIPFIFRDKSAFCVRDASLLRYLYQGISGDPVYGPVIHRFCTQ